jgi:hypothetical protein
MMDIKEFIVKEIINSSGGEELTDDQKNKIERDTQGLVEKLNYLQKLQSKILNNEDSLKEFIELARKYVSNEDG